MVNRYTERFWQINTVNEPGYLKQSTDMNVIFDGFLKRNYESFQDCVQLTTQEWKRVTYTQDGKSRIICPYRQLNSIMNNEINELKRVTDEMISESVTTYYNTLQDCYRLFNVRDVLNTMCNNFVTNGWKHTDIEFEYSKSIIHDELLIWVIEPMRDDIFKLIK